jgi:RNA polymerase sigma factor (TIGR02999 family)
MTEGPSDRVQALFDQAVELTPERRAAFLDASCPQDPALRAEVEALLAYDSDFSTDTDGLLKSSFVHEAYRQLSGEGDATPCNTRGYFFAAAAAAMRRILVENARRKPSGERRLPLAEFHRVSESPQDLLALDDALTRFAAEEPAKAQLVQLHFFAGLSIPEAAAALGVSIATAERWWVYARTWLFSELQGETDD